MLIGIIAMLFAGVFLVNGVPHFVQGITGQMHQTPFADPSSAVVNVIWGSANFIVGALLLRAGLNQEQPVMAVKIVIGTAAGIATALALANYWS